MRRVIIRDLEKIKKEYGYERKTLICDAQAAVFVEEKPKEQEIVFLMDRFGYAKTIDVASYEKNAQTVDSENRYVIRCMNTDRICIFTNDGFMHQLRMAKLPLKKIKDKGVPIDNLCNYSSEKQSVVMVMASSQLKDIKLLFTTKLGMMKFVDASEFEVSKQTIAATRLMDGDEVISIDAFDASHLKNSAQDQESPQNLIITGGYDGSEESGEAEGPDDYWNDGSGISSYIDPEDDQISFEFIDMTGPDDSGLNGADDEAVDDDGAGEAADGADTPDTAQDAPSQAQKASQNITSKMIVIQTRDGVFLRFRLSEVPEKKKGAIGVRGINLGKNDEIDKIYIVGFGDKASVNYKNKEVELMKIKLAKRAAKGTKLRN